MKRSGCLLISLFFLSLVSLATFKIWKSVGPLEYPRVVLEKKVSPDGLWIASVNEDHFSLGFGGDTLTGVVTLATSSYPKRIINLLVADTGGHVEERPRITWISSNILRVTVSSLIYLNVLVLHVDGVQIDLHLDPDNPPVVAAWLQGKGLLDGASRSATAR